MISKIRIIKSWLRKNFYEYFIANSQDNIRNKKNQIRLVWLIFSLLALFFFLLFINLHNFQKQPLKEIKKQKNSAKSENFDVENLMQGMKHEDSWIKTAGKEVQDIREKQEIIERKTKESIDQLHKGKVSQKEIRELLKQQRQELELEFSKRILVENEKPKEIESNELVNDLGNISFFQVPKKKNFEFGKYIPAGSYSRAVLISGVDASIGISGEANPRHVLMRVTSETTSAGFQDKNLKTDVLIGCLIQGQAVGDISSEKVYIRPMLMTCAMEPNGIIEIPVKGYVISQGKSGIRGNIISREGDLVLRSFLSGTISGIGSGLSRSFSSTPNINLGSPGGFFSSDKDRLKDIFSGGISTGVSATSDKLSDYFIKKAEQYQPVISIDEGTLVEVVFQEGFSLER